MIGSKSTLFWLWWRACWFFITPVVLSVCTQFLNNNYCINNNKVIPNNFFLFFNQIILVWSLYTFTSPTYGLVAYPDWGISLGWCITAFCLIWIPILAVWKVYKASGGPWQVKQDVHVLSENFILILFKWFFLCILTYTACQWCCIL